MTSPTSHTELSTLAQCERRWHYRYRARLTEPASPELQLGTMMDRAAAAFWRGDSWSDALNEEAHELGLIETAPDHEYLDEVPELEPLARAVWLMRRYEKHYADTRSTVTVLGEQVELSAVVPGTSQRHRAVLDAIWQLGDDLWVVERKTYGRQDRINLVHVDPQLTGNLWLARANGVAARGVIWDGIYTYRWKRDARPPRESFQMLFLDRHDDHVAAAQRELRAAISRRAAIKRGAVPMRNIGPLCNRCGYREKCFEGLAFPQDIELTS